MTAVAKTGPGTELPLRQQARQPLDDVAALERRRLRAKRLDCVVEAFEPGRRSAQTNDLRSSVSSGRVRSIGERSTPLRGGHAAGGAGSAGTGRRSSPDSESGASSSPQSRLRTGSGTDPREIEPCTRPELEEIDLDPCASSDVEEARQQHPAALDLVRLDAPLADESPKPVASRLEHSHGSPHGSSPSRAR